MQKTLFSISKMDCPCEENLVRMQLANEPAVVRLQFDLGKRQLTVFHHGNLSQINELLSNLNLGAAQLQTEDIENTKVANDHHQRKMLWWVLAINFGFFIFEAGFGIIAHSMGLLADSLDMLADSLVYILSLLAVGATVVFKKRVATAAGLLQLLLAALGFVEVVRRFVGVEVMPDFITMMVVASLALGANMLCIVILQKANNGQEAHIKASMIFTANDVIINLGVIAAAVLVRIFENNKPDLIIGALVFVLVSQGAWRILKLGK